MKRILFAAVCFVLLGACEKKTQHIQDQTEAINDTTDVASEEIAEETFDKSVEDSLSANK